MSLTPIVKWAGGKRQILDKIMLSIPKTFTTYFEPFVGGGALFLEIEPSKAIINDVNHELMSIYTCLKDEELYHLMLNELKLHESKHNSNYYYEIRSWDKNPRFELLPLWQRAARTIYLNKACFNGLYRVNSKGFFNVPFGKKEKIRLYDQKNLDAMHIYFKNKDVTILTGDFIEACRTAKSGDFVYFDPPYDPWEEKKSFTAYTKFDFTKEDQIRLANCFKDLTKRGVKCLLSNHNTEFIRELYSEFNIEVIPAKRMINSKASGRGFVEEVLISNYSTEEFSYAEK